MNDRLLGIQQMLTDGINYAKIGKVLGITRERVRVLAKRIPWPEGYIQIRDYAKKNDIGYNTALIRGKKGVLPIIRYGQFILVSENEQKRCKVCGSNLPEKHKFVCLSCKMKTSVKQTKRHSYYLKGLELPDELKLVYPKKSKRKEVVSA